MGALERAVAVGTKVARQLSKRSGTLVLRRRCEADIDITDMDWGIGRNDPEEIQESVVVNETVLQDWFVHADIYTSSSWTVKEPQLGDQLLFANGTTIETYEVMPWIPEPGQRFSERYRTHWRLHTKLIDES